VTTRKDAAPRGPIPELEPHCGSWVCTTPAGGHPMETFTRDTAEILSGAGWRVETAAQYLGRVNAEARARPCCR
jgi:hypothetical protein